MRLNRPGLVGVQIKIPQRQSSPVPMTVQSLITITAQTRRVTRLGGQLILANRKPINQSRGELIM